MSINNPIVFYGSQVYGEYLPKDRGTDYPDGSYLRTWRGDWFINRDGAWLDIYGPDIPPEIKTLCLLMGIAI